MGVGEGGEGNAYWRTSIPLKNNHTSGNRSSIPQYFEAQSRAAMWAEICQTMGPKFELKHPAVMPPLLSAANTSAKMMRTWNEKGHRREMPDVQDRNIYFLTLQARFALYLAQSLDQTLQSLRFYFHDGLGTLAGRQKNRSQRPASELADDKEDLAKLMYYINPKYSSCKMVVTGAKLEDNLRFNPRMVCSNSIPIWT
ncbi:hypothetical protein PILCRDRAFT_93235 [Piloderma croceum F 1598]|uniref:Uncharacterized protein n=1 Tax=Piloderma croceum (strain F 1598) TaxID=765440 RepID=A0A0C3AGR1_PILCF|nr:hypothetical protein PILCRDRAFT_93235 [Piloderma croceum F 1598]